jgi:Holliday junction resolvasome RuvABC ATP-dependent DNA helicase subunit
LTEDGLTRDMQNTLTFLLTKGKRTKADGEVVYQASVNTIATAIGKSRDSKAIALRVEPYLIEQGYLQVGHGGRTLTDAGIERAGELV